MNRKLIIALLLVWIGTFSTYATDLFSDEPVEKLFNIGLRVGVNSSNRTFPSDKFKAWNVNSWGSGFDAGVIVNLNIKKFFAVQPGIFFESRSSNYSYSEDYVNLKNEPDYFTQLGHVRTYNILVPVMASLRLNIADNLECLVEAGPYLQCKLHASDANKIQVIDQPTAISPLKVDYAKSNFMDWGFKLGAGLRINNHYSFLIHYLAGMDNVWKAPVEGGQNKAWTFTVGYDF